MADPALGILAGIASIAACVFAIRKTTGWLFPIKIESSIFIQRRNHGPDEIRATIINRSRESLYMVKCCGRSAQSIKNIIRRHLSNPFLKPNLYPCIWFGPQIYDLMGTDPIKIEPDQPIKLSHKLNFSLPIFAFTTPQFQIEVVISNGRTFRSSRLSIPNHWHISSQIKYSGEN